MSIRHLALMPPSTKSSAKLVRGTGFNVAWPPWIGAPMVSCSVTWPGYKLKAAGLGPASDEMTDVQPKGRPWQLQ
ncbi:hypothetical protein OOU_Y34scaffold01031g1 [Pyricularia oryzae Y34]|uniref:Uncharacterized protein n=2 Tax=Pyricularia oryzae TaxID=318829 RepID=A0AA97NMC0_PYRO3|nr:hypothetical protein OOU_Y34scaffold01031g1 [Pyricularia oryzae Y34]